MSLLSTGRRIGRTIQNAARMRVILSVFAKHGFSNLLERVNLGRFLLERITSSGDVEQKSVAERARISFEELGPTFVKLGQLLAGRPDLVPEEFVEEFARLHDNVQPLPFSTVLEVIRESFGEDYRQLFIEIDERPLGAASIAQVHRARLADGASVVVKVQRPGIIETIRDDLNVLFFLAELIETYIPEARIFNIVGIVEEYQRSLTLETNFIVEANSLRKFAQNFADDPRIKIPRVHMDLTRDRVLTMEAIDGIPLSSDAAMRQPGVNADEVFKAGFNAYLKMVFVHGLFHGDLHAGNLLILSDGKIGLIDFGVVGRLNSKTQSAVAQMLIALSREDYDRLAFEYMDLAPFNDTVDVDHVARDLRGLLAPFFGLTMKDVNLGQILLSSSSVAARHQLMLPSELMLFFKSLVGIESLGRRISPDFDVLAHVNTFAGELLAARYQPGKLIHDGQLILRETQALLNQLPRQMHHLLRRLNSPQSEWKLNVRESDQLRQVISMSFNLLFLGIIISTLILSAAIVYSQGEPRQEGVAIALLLMAWGLGTVAFINYIRK